mmetsp:Transcript_10707/g.15768  ORF Transcript_10707/g.15768 Transcript_10707/m.15768 type:complete len:425 (+) Transcript_10707:117-1391(+)|eukprot:CAMPEP_0194211084 /NCGR_PEP_ID=MMETSP0156-20130528/9295_1 /TAXON_ID=33649 /ORGANISM="Thalassionema nitzschioides, Strain L26-B" /LENGTH=424 /DNA_ID=CAMNT_0038938517 /DNA_START=191 /DNA_END=1465 /DNA_ORIENTATION=+
MSSAGEIAGGFIIPVVAGILNGSWNAAFSPAANLAVAPVASDQPSSEKDPNPRQYDLSHHHAWVLFQFYSAVANIILCLFWAGGPARVSYIVSEAPSSSVWLIVLFSILMGIGILLFGEACRISGVGMGTNLTIGIILILGTLLPLGMNEQVATPSGGMIIGGVVVSCVGLFFSMRSLQIRTKEEHIDKKLTVSTSNDEVGDGTESVSNAKMGDAEEGAAGTTESTGDSPEEPKTDVPKTNEPKTHSTFLKITLCVLAAVFSSTLQFAFVFGSDLIKIAESPDGPGSTPKSGSAAIIWLFVIPLSTISSISYGLYESRNTPIKHLWRSPISRHIKIFIFACIPWIGHIHLYGIAANLLLPPHIAAAVAWPILMSTTVAWGMILSLKLGEWKGASADAQTKQKLGLGLLAIGIVVVMASVALYDK